MQQKKGRIRWHIYNMYFTLSAYPENNRNKRQEQASGCDYKMFISA